MEGQTSYAACAAIEKWPKNLFNFEHCVSLPIIEVNASSSIYCFKILNNCVL